MRIARLFPLGTFLFVSLIAITASAARPRVEVEISMEPAMSGNAAAQKWVKAFNDAGIADVHFRSWQDGDRAKVEAKGKGASAAVKVTAVLDSRRRAIAFRFDIG